MIEVTRKVTVLADYHVTDFTPCCEAWRRQLGENLIVLSEGSGVVPSNAYVKTQRAEGLSYLPFSEPFLFCPFCGISLTFKFIDSTVKIPPLPGTFDEVEPQIEPQIKI